MYLVVEKVSIDHHAKVAAIVDPIERVGAFAGKEEHGLGIDINEFKHGGRQRVLHTVTVLELPQPHIERFVIGETVVQIIFLDDTRKVVHEQEGETVGDTSFRPEQCALQIESAVRLFVVVVVRITALSVTVNLYAVRQFFEPINRLAITTLPHGRHRAENSQGYGQ